VTPCSPPDTSLPAGQHALWARCVHPGGGFEVFRRDQIEQSIPARFEQQVDRYPDRLAVKSPHHAWTYTTLNRNANRLAHAILAQRGSVEETVALLLKGDALFLAAVLAVLKAGKTYASLSPSDPRARLIAMTENLQPSVIVTDSQHRLMAQDLAPAGCAVLDIHAPDTLQPDSNPGVTISPDRHSWILYTSGSTGQPKGVTQNHRNVLHLIMNYTNALRICRHDRMTLLHSGLTLDIFGALLNGAALYPLDIKERGLATLADWLVQNEITVYRSFPTTFRQFTDTLAGRKAFPQVRVIHLGGETVIRRDLERYRKHFSPPCILVNHLNSNEAGGMATYYIDHETSLDEPTVPVGYPVPDNEVILVDDCGNAVGPGDTGEIAVRSRHLALGYWRRPDLTRERFHDDPTGGDQRVFLTGDLGRRLPDGCLVHLGRKDFQVKVRGYRVELAEVEAALQTIPGINEAVVVARDTGDGDVRLVAYMTPAEPPGLTVTTVRSLLVATLPDPMIPSAFVFLAALPVTPNGKVDRRSLPAPERLRPNLDVPFTRARTPLEERLVGIWSEVLDLAEVGVHDHFLDLGGDSLRATMLVTRVLAQLQVALAPRTLLDAPTVAAMAQLLAESLAGRMESDALSRVLAEVEELSEEEARAGLNPESS